MLERIKNYVEKRVNRQVSTKELEAALEDAKNNITCNYLLLGYDVTAKQFLDILINCVKIRLKLAPAAYNPSSDPLNSIVVLDQGGQVKRITDVTILDYNPTTLFGITIDGKKTWLGKYDTKEEAENVKNIINTSLIEKRRCNLRYLDERTGDA